MHDAVLMQIVDGPGHRQQAFGSPVAIRAVRLPGPWPDCGRRCNPSKNNAGHEPAPLHGCRQCWDAASWPPLSPLAETAALPRSRRAGWKGSSSARRSGRDPSARLCRRPPSRRGRLLRVVRSCRTSCLAANCRLRLRDHAAGSNRRIARAAWFSADEPRRGSCHGSVRIAASKSSVSRFAAQDANSGWFASHSSRAGWSPVCRAAT